MKTIRRMATALLLASASAGCTAPGDRGRAKRAPFANNKLTTDAARYRRNSLLYETYPQLALGGPTVAWIRAACMAADIGAGPGIHRQASRCRCCSSAPAPTRSCRPARSQHYARRLEAARMLTIDGARHEILQEADIFREQLLAAFDAFVPGSDEDLDQH